MNNIIFRCNSGYTFIELLVALTILGLMITPVLMMLSGSFLSIKNSGSQSAAVSLCRQQMETVKALGYDSALELYSTENTDSNTPEENFKEFPGFKRTTNVRPFTLSCTNDPDFEIELLLIEITVTWSEGKSERKESLKGLLSDR